MLQKIISALLLRSKATSTQNGEAAKGNTLNFDIVGESFYQDALNSICGGKTREGHEHHCKATLTAEPDNPYDANAVAVIINGLKVGHLPKATAAKHHDRLLGEPQHVDAVILGGWYWDKKDEGHYGVKISF